jgi:thiol:disulfide interchange protein DsbD
LAAPIFPPGESGVSAPAADVAPAVDVGGVPGIAGAGGIGGRSAISQLLLMLSLAFVGGLILNLMPCVLPVLSLKIFDFVKRAGEARWKVFSHGLVFTGGVLVSFWILAGLLLILRSGGSQLGWGFQLQSPGFLMVLIALFFFFSLNLFGVFELGYIFTRVGGTGTQSGWLGSFMAGVTATVVATPCTAPFMGSAMGYAFTQPAYYAMLVFTFLGLGMAAPYLLLSGFPSLMKFLPKPGEWMEHLKQFMGFPLLATAIWLAWVLGKQAGVDALAILLFVLLLAGLSAWILGKWTALHRTTPVRVVAALIAFVIFVPAFALVLIYMDQIRETRTGANAGPGRTGPGRTGSGQVSGPTAEGLQWEPFSEARVLDLVTQGRPVFVDFTADWCLSCKVNERVAFGSADVTRKFLDLKIAMLKADWTLRDEPIARALAKYGRNSIPLYVLYDGTGMDAFVILPEVLSPGILLEALNKLAAEPKTTMN